MLVSYDAHVITLDIHGRAPQLNKYCFEYSETSSVRFMSQDSGIGHKLVPIYTSPMLQFHVSFNLSILFVKCKSSR